MDLINAKAYLKKDNIEPLNNQNNNETKIGLVFFAISWIVGLLFAFVLDNAINNSQWALFFIFGTIIISFIALNALVNFVGKWRVFTVIVFFIPNLFFNFSFIGLLLFGIASLIIVIYTEKIRASLKNMRKINTKQALNVGISGILLATSIVISTQYFVVISKKNTRDLIPKISHSVIFNNLLGKYFVKNEHGGILTVDNFIKRILKTNSADHLIKLESLIPISSNLEKNNDTKSRILNTVNKTISSTENRMVVSVRNAISERINKKLTGNENVADVFAIFFQKELENLVMSNTIFTKFAPDLFALMLFFALVSTTGVIKFPVIWISSLLFRFLEYLGLFKVVSIKQEVENISFNIKN